MFSYITDTVISLGVYTYSKLGVRSTDNKEESLIGMSRLTLYFQSITASLSRTIFSVFYFSYSFSQVKASMSMTPRQMRVIDKAFCKNQCLYLTALGKSILFESYKSFALCSGQTKG